MVYWQKEIECMPRENLNQLKLERLKRTVEKVYEKVPFYKKAFKEKGIEPGDIKTLRDLRHLPFTTKIDFRENYPFGLFAEDMSKVVRFHSSSGTTGKPTVVGYTKNDINTWSELMARSLYCGGTRPNSIVHNAYGYGLFTGGLGVHYGVEKLGAAVLPVSGGNTKRQIMLMQDFGSDVLTCTPSYALHLAEVIEEMGVRDKLKLKYGIFGAEPWSENMRKELEEKLNIQAIDIFGLSEIIGPGVSIECLGKRGMHVFEDNFIVEIIDPITEEPLPPGEKGELVITTINKEALPVLRYRTRDISVLDESPCDCGRTLARMQKITGRTDDMIIIRGVNVFPTQIESVLLEIGETQPHYMLYVEREGNMDVLEIWVEVSERMFSDHIKGMESLEKRIRGQIESVLGISARVKLVEPKTIPRSEGKAKRVEDRRNI